MDSLAPPSTTSISACRVERTQAPESQRPSGEYPKRRASNGNGPLSQLPFPSKPHACWSVFLERALFLLWSFERSANRPFLANQSKGTLLHTGRLPLWACVRRLKPCRNSAKEQQRSVFDHPLRECGDRRDLG